MVVSSWQQQLGWLNLSPPASCPGFSQTSVSESSCNRGSISQSALSQELLGLEGITLRHHQDHCPTDTCSCTAQVTNVSPRYCYFSSSRVKSHKCQCQLGTG